MVSLRVNQKDVEAPAPGRNLLSYLRFDLGLTGAKYGCGEGVCGACTVLVDGKTVRSCQTTVGSVAGGTIITIEGLAPEGQLHPIQEAFVAETAFQCGYCTPGFIMTAAALLQREPHPTHAQVREALAWHICRCGTYQRIEDAIVRAGAVDGEASS